MIKAEQLNKLAYCGIYCGGCSNFLQNANCAGCRTETELLADCPTIVCAQKKDIIHCGECSEFPCQMQHDFYNDGVAHHALALKNIQATAKMGLENWLEFMKTDSLCSCGNKRYWLSELCPDCKKTKCD
jgi:Protein of unknown function (DUF3795)